MSDALPTGADLAEPHADSASLRYAWFAVGVLLLAQTFSFLDRMIMGLLVGPIRESFQISDAQYSLIAGLAFSLFYAIRGLPRRASPTPEAAHA